MKPDVGLDIETQIQLVLLEMEEAITSKKGWIPNDYSHRIMSLYEPLIEQAREETAREAAEKIFERIEKLPLGISQHTMGLDYYDQQGNEVLVHQPDCLKCKYEHIKTEFLERRRNERR